MSVNGATEHVNDQYRKKGFSMAQLQIAGGDTTVTRRVASVPEPSSLALFGTGTLALGALLRRKLSGSHASAANPNPRTPANLAGVFLLRQARYDSPNGFRECLACDWCEWKPRMNLA